jgi:hypothetical protein
MQIISNKTTSMKNMIGNAIRTAKEDGLLAAFGGMLAGTVGIGATMAMLEHLPMRISNNPVIEGAAIGGQMLLATGSVILTTAALIKIGSVAAEQIIKGVDFLKEKVNGLDAHPENSKVTQEFEKSTRDSLLEVKRVDITPTILQKLEEHRAILDQAISFIEASSQDGSQAKMVEALTDFSKSLDEKASKETMQEALNKLQDQYEQKMPAKTTEVGLER